MRKILLLLIVTIFATTGCSQFFSTDPQVYDDLGEIFERLEDVENLAFETAGELTVYRAANDARMNSLEGVVANHEGRIIFNEGQIGIINNTLIDLAKEDAKIKNLISALRSYVNSENAAQDEATERKVRRLREQMRDMKISHNTDIQRLAKAIEKDARIFAQKITNLYSYIDNKDSRILEEMRNADANIRSDLKTNIKTAKLDLLEIMRAADRDVLENAKDYTDSEFEELRDNFRTAIASALEDAKAYTDEMGDDLEDYIDESIEDALDLVKTQFKSLMQFLKGKPVGDPTCDGTWRVTINFYNELIAYIDGEFADERFITDADRAAALRDARVSMEKYIAMALLEYATVVDVNGDITAIMRILFGDKNTETIGFLDMINDNISRLSALENWTVIEFQEEINALKALINANGISVRDYFSLDEVDAAYLAGEIKAGDVVYTIYPLKGNGNAGSASTLWLAVEVNGSVELISIAKPSGTYSYDFTTGTISNL